MVTGTKPHEGLSGAASYALNADAVAELIDERDGETANGLAPATVNRWLAQIIAILTKMRAIKSDRVSAMLVQNS